MRHSQTPGDQSGVSPLRIVEAVANVPELSRSSYIVEHFRGLQLRLSGTIMEFEDTSTAPFATVHFYDVEEALWGNARFPKPLPAQVKLLRKGDHVQVSGKLINVHNRGIHLENCVLLPSTPRQPARRQELNHRYECLSGWWRDLTVQVIAGVVVLIVASLFGLWWRYWHH